jgi:DNA mismatch repair protein MutL
LPIKILPPRLANQIAAGEVVERPASVVKELVENSLDSAASSIEIEIEQGGYKKILVRDNGTGIHHQELPLALSRHATSKISKLDDLEAICSLGFRGEALASISSVARLTLSSKPKEQSQAWQAFCEGRDMQVQLNPVAHPDGTSVEVLDLFFNTPARRKFLRTEKTEFTHIDEVVRRIALSRFDVSCSLKHNGKLLRKYPKVSGQSNQEGEQLKRLSAICGKEFAENSIKFNSQYQHFDLQGWVIQPELAKSQADFQYFYVNGRMMRDKLINHAVRQAFEGLIATDLQASYVLYLTLNPDQVDVNVHPAKHEVRFHQTRLVHDFIFRALTDGLNQYFAGIVKPSDKQILPQAELNHEYIKPLQNSDKPRIDEDTNSYPASQSSNHSDRPTASASFTGQKIKAQHLVNSARVIEQSSSNYQHLMTPNSTASPSISEVLSAKGSELNTNYQELSGLWLRVNEKQILVNVAQRFYLVEISKLQAKVLTGLYSQGMPVSQPLLMPVSIKATANLLSQAKKLYQPLLDNSVEIGWTPNRIILRKVPAGLRQLCWIECMEQILNCQDFEVMAVRQHLLNCIALNNQFTHTETQALWQQFSAITPDIESGITQISTQVALADWIMSCE